MGEETNLKTAIGGHYKKPDFTAQQKKISLIKKLPPAWLPEPEDYTLLPFLEWALFLSHYATVCSWANLVYIFRLLKQQFGALFVPERLHTGNQRAIWNITLGTEYVQQIAFGKINKDCHCGLNLQYWQTEKQRTSTLDF